ncbi:MAG: pyrroline-5-carboxylate reductase [Dysosmobacter sp.]
MAIYGFIGTGNMGGAMARAARRALSGQEVLLANRTPAKAEALARELDCRTGDNAAVAQEADYIFLGVKPQMMAEMLAGIAPVLAQRKNRFILVSMAAGLTISRLQELAGGDYPILRIMPNTPSAIGAGMVFYTPGPGIPDEEVRAFLETMAGAGRFAPLPEHLMDAGSAVAGCGPAFADLFLEALADGGVACGLPRAAALTFAAQMMLGTAQLALESGAHPGALKDAVCSPGGSTIQGVRTLEKAGFRSAVIEAVIAACEKSADLGK